MDVRKATDEDRSRISEIARRSLEASYSLSPGTIEAAVTQWYDSEEFADKLDRSDLLMLVGEEGGEIVAFSEIGLFEGEEYADVLWLHVHPDYRGEGLGSDLFDAVDDHIDDTAATRLRGRVLSINEAGNTFYQEMGFEKVGEGEVEIDGSPHSEVVYVEADATGLKPFTTDEGETVYVDHDDADRGTLAAFHPVYLDEDRDDKYGYHCAKCDSMATAMDAMGRIECGECGNSRKPVRWDAAYM